MHILYVKYDTGSIERKPGQGRPRASTATEDRYLSIIARRNRGATASQLSRDLYAATGTRASRVTVSKRLHEIGLFARRHAVCASLTSTNRRVRLAWCREHRDWSMDQWATVLFTDESRNGCLPKHRLSPYVHMERTRDRLPTLQCPRN
ncbi:hypothetical protein AVEN_40823-1 [Araneus ventricosus]|uniref:Transposase Tc1-like domain-containing protein n=1 Tax=Araneus ventricosus TaxID=182803 RepID=A0A4Y2CFY5_ARAVE|nr:hypothetical protein AVEN_40823-1 [Araneus ventricosus]